MTEQSPFLKYQRYLRDKKRLEERTSQNKGEEHKVYVSDVVREINSLIEQGFVLSEIRKRFSRIPYTQFRALYRLRTKNTEMLNFRFPKELKEKLQQSAINKRRRLSLHIRKILLEYIDNEEKPKELQRQVGVRV